MKVSVRWLHELAGAGLPVDRLAHILTMGGLEVEEVTPVAGAFDRIVVAQVKSVSPHPNADKLRVTEVDAGTGATLQIVCGAPNVAAGQKVPCAVVGAKLPGLEIRQAKLRGVESNGMLCSARELGLSDDHAGLLVLPEDAPVGKDIREYLDLDDTVLTLKLTPNRGDCLSMFGVARDVAALVGEAAELPAVAPVAVTIADSREISISDSAACGHYFGRVVRGLDLAAKTPAWMARRLERAGLRPRNPLVDITNFVMLERGQPMHAFDNAKLSGGIDVRLARPGEELKLLNEQWAEYIPNLVLITDASGPVALGGVMGGFDSMVTGATTDVFLEAAFFPPEAIQGRARALQLTSDAAYRFERGIDFAGTRAALERATELTLTLCGGRAGPITEAHGNLPARTPVRVRPARVRALLGYDVPDAFMADAFGRLGCAVTRRDGVLEVVPPSWRFDLAIEEDFVEEVARVHGYEHVPAAAPRSTLPMLSPVEGARTRYGLKRTCAALGYQEVINYSFVSSQWEDDFAGNATAVRLANPIASTMNVMRSTLLGGLVAAVRSNLNRDEERVRLFEVGRCFLGEGPEPHEQPERLAAITYGGRLPEQWAEKTPAADFFDAKGDLEAIAGPVKLEFRADHHPACHPGRCARVWVGSREVGVVGELHPRLQLKYDLPLAPVLFEIDADVLLAGRALRFSGVSRMPTVRRDLAVVVPETLSAGVILGAIRASIPQSVREVEVFDEYRGKGVGSGGKSLAFRIVMQDTARTLTDAEVEEIVGSIRHLLVEKFQALPRT
ncbi:MAG: phenylalanine--tRNA ligase subunit beta [Betaproteobacteria bacterium]|nr:phenylalanine--tRNA ligase subunit beta [Betaproteobacteria bacterium]